MENNIINNIDKLSILKDINEKIKIFQYFFNNFQEIINEYNNFSKNTLKQFIGVHITNLNDDEISLSEQIIKI